MKKKWVLRHCDLDLWPKVTNFNRVWASAVSNHLAKTASKSVLPFGWKFVHKKCPTHRQTHTHRHTDTQTNWSENITPPRFRGGVTKNTWQNLHFFIICVKQTLMMQITHKRKNSMRKKQTFFQSLLFFTKCRDCIFIRSVQ